MESDLFKHQRSILVRDHDSISIDQVGVALVAEFTPSDDLPKKFEIGLCNQNADGSLRSLPQWHSQSDVGLGTIRRLHWAEINAAANWFGKKWHSAPIFEIGGEIDLPLGKLEQLHPFAVQDRQIAEGPVVLQQQLSKQSLLRPAQRIESHGDSRILEALDLARNERMDIASSGRRH